MPLKYNVAHPCPATNIDPSSGYYFLADPADTKVKYQEAKTSCAAIGMEIAIVDTERKQAFIETNNLIGAVNG